MIVNRNKLAMALAETDKDWIGRKVNEVSFDEIIYWKQSRYLIIADKAMKALSLMKDKEKEQKS